MVAGTSAYGRVGGGVLRSPSVFGRCVGVFCVGVGLLLVCGVVSAGAASIHGFAGSFGAAGSSVVDPYPLGSVAGGVAADDSGGLSQGDVYVTDPAGFRVEKFDGAGHFVLMFGKHVNKTREASGSEAEKNVCTAVSGDVCQAGVAGTGGAGEFSEPLFVAVDDSGGASSSDVYVGDSGSGAVYKFNSNGTFLSVNTGAGESFGPLAGITVDPAGDLLVYTQEATMSEYDPGGVLVHEWSNPVGERPVGIGVDEADDSYVVDGFGFAEELNVNGEKVSRITGAGATVPTGLAFDAMHNDLYLDEGFSVSHFECVPGVSCVAVDTFAVVGLSAGSGLGVDSGSGAVYAAVAGGGAAMVQRFARTLEATTGAATGVETTVATLHGVVNPSGSLISECKFDYGEDLSVPCEQTPSEVGSGSSPVAVSAHVSGLHGGSVYRYGLVASNAAGTVNASKQELTTGTVASIGALAAKTLTGSSGELTASIDPHGLDTTYKFEWGTSTGYGSSAPEPEADIGEGEGSVAVSHVIGGLSPNVTYHWRVVARDGNGVTVSPDQTFIYSTQPVTLPDGRQYEMVTPPRKNGALIGALFIGMETKVTEDSNGPRVVASSIQCLENTQACNGVDHLEGAPFEFKRTGSGWVTQALSPSASEFPATEAWDFGANEGTGLFGVAIAGHPNQWLARQPDGSFETIGPVAETLVGGGAALNGQVATDDLSHMIYSSGASLWPSFDQGQAGSVYEYVGRNNTAPTLVGVSGGAGSTQLISTCETRLGGGDFLQNELGSLSGDGRTVYFTAFPCSEGGSDVPVFELYARIDQARTEAISEPQALSPGPRAECVTAECITNTEMVAPPGSNPRWRAANFSGASGDGSRVFFTSTQQLTDNATQDPNSGDSAFGARGACGEAHTSGCNLYESECSENCENPGSPRKLSDASAGDSSGGGPQVQGVMAVSSDGSHVYFVAKGVLTTTPNSEGKVAFPGEENLYVFQHSPGSADHVAFIGRLSEADSNEWNEGGIIANVTPDGRYLVFTSHRALTADDTRTEGPAQVYRYDAQTPALTRISIGEEGYNDNGNESTNDASIAIAFRGHGSPSRTDPTMSDDGSFVFFQSTAGLTRTALNNLPAGANNVYEYHNGHITLLTDGKDTAEGGKGFGPVELLGSDASGTNVFFSTDDPLVPQDTDTQRDFYDAHQCTSHEPCFPPPAIPTECTEEGCHTPTTPTNETETPASLTYTGPSNKTPQTPPNPPTITLLKHHLHGPHYTITINIPAPGTIHITSPNTHPITRTNTKPGTYKLTLTLTTPTKHTLHKHHQLTIHPHITYTPTTTNTPTTTTPTLTLTPH